MPGTLGQKLNTIISPMLKKFEDLLKLKLNIKPSSLQWVSIALETLVDLFS